MVRQLQNKFVYLLIYFVSKISLSLKFKNVNIFKINSLGNKSIDIYVKILVYFYINILILFFLLFYISFLLQYYLHFLFLLFLLYLFLCFDHIYIYKSGDIAKTFMNVLYLKTHTLDNFS